MLDPIVQPEILIPCPHGCVNALRAVITIWPNGNASVAFNGHTATHDEWSGRAHQLARGLVEIAEQAMPDTYLQTDSRVKLAREVLDA